MASLVPDSGPRPDRRWTARALIRTFGGAAFVGLVVGGVVGGVLGRLAMRLLVITSDARLKGLLTDDEAKVNQFTFGGTIGFVLFTAIGGAVLAWLYVAFRGSMPKDVRVRAAIWGLLFFGIQGSGVFQPDGFDFTRLSPRWLAVLLFTVIFLAVGALIAIGVEQTVDRWPGSFAGALPIAPLLLAFPVLLVALAATLANEANERWPLARVAGALLMLLAAGIWLGPTTANVIRILA